MNNANIEKGRGRYRNRFGWIVEIAVVASVVPPIVYAVLALNDLPIA